MAFMSPVCVIIAEHPTVVIAVEKLVDESEIVFRHSPISSSQTSSRIVPILLAQRIRARSSITLMSFRWRLPTGFSLAQIGHYMPYLPESWSRLALKSSVHAAHQYLVAAEVLTKQANENPAPSVNHGPYCTGQNNRRAVGRLKHPDSSSRTLEAKQRA